MAESVECHLDMAFEAPEIARGLDRLFRARGLSWAVRRTGQGWCYTVRLPGKSEADIRFATGSPDGRAEICSPRCQLYISGPESAAGDIERLHRDILVQFLRVTG